jgi:hypothetical protein
MTLGIERDVAMLLGGICCAVVVLAVAGFVALLLRKKD